MNQLHVAMITIVTTLALMSCLWAWRDIAQRKKPSKLKLDAKATRLKDLEEWRGVYSQFIVNNHPNLFWRIEQNFQGYYYFTLPSLSDSILYATPCVSVVHNGRVCQAPLPTTLDTPYIKACFFAQWLTHMGVDDRDIYFQGQAMWAGKYTTDQQRLSRLIGLDQEGGIYYA